MFAAPSVTILLSVMRNPNGEAARDRRVGQRGSGPVEHVDRAAVDDGDSAAEEEVGPALDVRRR